MKFILMVSLLTCVFLTASFGEAESLGYAVSVLNSSTSYYKVGIESKRVDADQKLKMRIRWQEGPQNSESYNDIDATGIYDSSLSEADIKAGDEVYLVDTSEKVKVLGTNFFHKFLVDIESGTRQGSKLADVLRTNIAVESGCNGKVCVGQEAIVASGDPITFQHVKLVALNVSGTFIGSDIDTNKIFAGIAKENVVLTDGCTPSQKICVGRHTYDMKEKVFVKTLSYSQNYENDLIESGPRRGLTYINNNEHASLEKECRKGICVGETYWSTWGNLFYVAMGFDSQDQALLAIPSDLTQIDRILTHNWLRKENTKCNKEGDLCVGDPVFRAGREPTNDPVTIFAIQEDNNLILKVGADAYDYDVLRSELAKISGCSSDKKICVDQSAFIKSEGKFYRGQITGFWTNGNIRIRYHDGTYATVSRDLISDSGCSGAICHESDFK